MKTSNYTVVILEPENGYLTQSADIDVTNRTLSKKVYLSANDSPENWKEITEDEAEDYRKQKEEAVNEYNSRKLAEAQGR